MSALNARRFEVAVSAFVGALALAVSTYNVYLQRVQIRAQVWPHVEWMYNDVEGFTWMLSNVGVGPAQVAGVRVTVDDAPTKSWDEVFALFAKKEAALAPLVDGTTIGIDSSHMTIAGVVLAPGATKEAISFRGGIPLEMRDALRRSFQRMRTEICFCSTLGDCWVYPGYDAVPSCPKDRYTFKD